VVLIHDDGTRFALISRLVVLRHGQLNLIPDRHHRSMAVECLVDVRVSLAQCDASRFAVRLPALQICAM
jgi:hypothetical protein